MLSVRTCNEIEVVGVVWIEGGLDARFRRLGDRSWRQAIDEIGVVI